MGDVVQRIEAMADQLATDGWLTQDKVGVALHDVPRHAFVPQIAWTGDGDRADRGADPDGWLDLAFAQEAIITQLDDGATGTATGEGKARTPAKWSRPETGPCGMRWKRLTSNGSPGVNQAGTASA